MLMGHSRVINHVINCVCIVVHLKRTLTRPVENQTFQCIHVQILTSYYHQNILPKVHKTECTLEIPFKKKNICTLEIY